MVPLIGVGLSLLIGPCCNVFLGSGWFHEVDPRKNPQFRQPPARHGGGCGVQQVTFGALLRELRAKAGLTQEELAAAAGLSPRSVSDLERGVAQTRAGTPPGCWPMR